MVIRGNFGQVQIVSRQSCIAASYCVHEAPESLPGGGSVDLAGRRHRQALVSRFNLVPFLRCILRFDRECTAQSDHHSSSANNHLRQAVSTCRRGQGVDGHRVSSKWTVGSCSSNTAARGMFPMVACAGGLQVKVQTFCERSNEQENAQHHDRHDQQASCQRPKFTAMSFCLRTARKRYVAIRRSHVTRACPHFTRRFIACCFAAFPFFVGGLARRGAKRSNGPARLSAGLTGCRSGFFSAPLGKFSILYTSLLLCIRFGTVLRIAISHGFLLIRVVWYCCRAKSQCKRFVRPALTQRNFGGPRSLARRSGTKMLYRNYGFAFRAIEFGRDTAAN